MSHFSCGVRPLHRFHQTFDVVGIGFDARFDSPGFQGLGRFRANGCRFDLGKLFQQRFNLDGSRADDQATLVNYLRANNTSGRGDWMTIGAMTMLTLLILVALLRRRAAAKGEDDGESEE